MNLLLPLAICLIACFLYFIGKSTAQKGVHKNFRLEPGRYKLIGTDLGNSEGKVRLSYSGVSGDPDAVFEDRKRQRIVVGEHKARKYRQGLRLREYYQVMLYIGLAQQRWHSHDVVGLISFTDRTVWVDFDKGIFEALMEMRGEASTALRTKKVINNKPLHKRRQIRLPR